MNDNEDYPYKWKTDDPILKWKFSYYGSETNYEDYKKSFDNETF